MNSVTILTHEQGEQWVKDQKAIWSTPGVILLNGPMGAGKTQISRWILAELGSADAASPTYAIHHRYETKKFSVDHFDLYRLQSDWDLESTGFWDIVNEPDNLVLVEWAERLPKESFPKNRRIAVVDIDLQSDGKRVISLQVFQSAL
jgi:tRNA threonylcarbamoyladenosine biosynthesis protein TsaE